MAQYELVHEILNSCPGNQMRDIFFQEVQTDDPEAYVRTILKGDISQLWSETLSDGSIEVRALCSGINHRFLFTLF